MWNSLTLQRAKIKEKQSDRNKNHGKQKLKRSRTFCDIEGKVKINGNKSEGKTWIQNLNSWKNKLFKSQTSLGHPESPIKIKQRVRSFSVGSTESLDKIRLVLTSKPIIYVSSKNLINFASLKCESIKNIRCYKTSYENMYGHYLHILIKALFARFSDLLYIFICPIAPYMINFYGSFKNHS